ncbi:VanZ family protein [Bhargavaea cecembensis]|uniref:VanZ family protein n=1 Tax=Bhargavaea cecembensis TaxID=394098 RepID=UPI000590707C|nr:VanZ family protein [Bhargavaea cecembensis]
MAAYETPLLAAVAVFFLGALVLTVPWMVYTYRKYGFLSIWTTVVVYSFVFYLIAALFLVLLPLPSVRDTCQFQKPGTQHVSLVPFFFVGDVIRSSGVVLSRPGTYAAVLRESAFWQALFNFFLLLPLGVYLRYFLRERKFWKRAFAIGFGLSLFFEVTQLTGIYGIYNCPYRVFDVDDLILNSTGALFGFLMAPVLLALFPSRADVLAKSERIEELRFVPPLSQLLAIVVDYAIVRIAWIVYGLVLPAGVVSEFVFMSAGLLIVLFVVPMLGRGRTIGMRVLRIRLAGADGGVPSWIALLKRTAAIYLPWLATIAARALEGYEPAFGTPEYMFAAWLTVGALVLQAVIWLVIVVHMLVVLIGRGKRAFYFDRAAGVEEQRDVE